MSDHVARYLEYLRSAAGRARCDRFWSTLARHLPSHAERSALDAGGGVGELSARLVARGWRVTLLDRDEAMLAAANEARIDGVETIVGSFEHARTWRGRFDLVACHLALEYAVDPRSALADVAGAVRSRGLLSLVVRTLAGEIEKQSARGERAAVERATSERRFTNEHAGETGMLFERDEIERAVRDRGFEILELDDRGRYAHVIARATRE